MRGFSCGFIVLLTLLMQGCAHFSAASRIKNADLIADKAGWKADTLHTQFFNIESYAPSSKTNKTVKHHIKKNETLTVYIEGDGLAWVSRTQPSSNPTPMNPLALKLALKDHGNVVYLGRPCQYVESKNCTQKYWTNARFGPEVVASMDQAVSLVKAKFHAKNIILVGYSGGGAIAALVAARRHDVVRLITVVGNLDPKKWTQLLDITPLTGSLNPADYWRELMNIPQLLLIGGKDKTIPLAVDESYRDRFPKGKQPQIKVVPDFNHHCCWSTQWPELMH